MDSHRKPHTLELNFPLVTQRPCDMYRLEHVYAVVEFHLCNRGPHSLAAELYYQSWITCLRFHIEKTPWPFLTACLSLELTKSGAGTSRSSAILDLRSDLLSRLLEPNSRCHFSLSCAPQAISGLVWTVASVCRLRHATVARAGHASFFMAPCRRR